MEKCKILVHEKRTEIELLSKKLLEKDILSFMDVNEVLGERPFEPKENFKRFLEEIMKPKEQKKEDQERDETEKKPKNEEVGILEKF